MSWVTVIWSMVAATCLTLAATHLLVWIRRRNEWSHLFLALSAIGAMVIGGCELAVMMAKTPEQQMLAIDIGMTSIFVITTSLIVFLRVYLNAGRAWLMWLAIAARLVPAVLNFVVEQNLHYTFEGPVRQISFLGETISHLNGRQNTSWLIAPPSILLMMIYIADVMVTMWRRGEARRALVICGSMLLFTILSTAHTMLVFRGVLEMPFLISVTYLAVVMAMTYEVSSDLIRSAQIFEDLNRSQASLLESERRMDLASRAVGLGMWLWDLRSGEVWMSPVARTLFGLPLEVPMNIDRVNTTIHPDDRQIVHEAIQTAIRDREEYHCDFRVKLSETETRWLAGRGRVDFAASGEPLHMFGVSIDITARRQAESEAARRREELTHLSRVTMLGELAGSLAHELNQPLAAILNNAEAARRFLSQEDTNLDEVRAILDDIISDDKRAGDVIRGLRLLLKKGELDKQPMQINNVIGEVLKLMRGDLLNRGVTVVTSLDDGLPMICVDHVQMQQVLLNLISNACDAMCDPRASGRQLTITTRCEENGEVLISVEDQGCGIEPEMLVQVFESFYTTKDKGMGLGLAVCRTIVTAHGGRLWAQNNEDRGASFHVALPANGKTGHNGNQ